MSENAGSGPYSEDNKDMGYFQKGNGIFRALLLEGVYVYMRQRSGIDKG